MLINNQASSGGHRHNYVRVAFIIGTLVLFIGYITANELAEHRNSRSFVNATWIAGNRSAGNRSVGNRSTSEVQPSSWVSRSLTALNYLWQLAWLFYSLTFIYRRSSSGYLYLAPNTLTPTFYIIYCVGFVIQAVWVYFFQQNYFVWTWIVYLISFLLLSLALFIINNNLAVNKKIYETEGFNRDVWFLRFFAQNGVAFFVCWTAVRFVLAFDTFLQVRLALSVANAGTIALLIAGLIAILFYFGSNFNAALVEKCTYQFAPWIVFIIYFWGVVEKNWKPKHVGRNNIIAVVELVASLVAAVVALTLFTIRYRTSKIDTLA